LAARNPVMNSTDDTEVQKAEMIPRNMLWQPPATVSAAGTLTLGYRSAAAPALQVPCWQGARHKVKLLFVSSVAGKITCW
jgi:hypothetical protein